MLSHIPVNQTQYKPKKTEDNPKTDGELQNLHVKTILQASY
jgi:hypothetical protein